MQLCHCQDFHNMSHLTNRDQHRSSLNKGCFDRCIMILMFLDDVNVKRRILEVLKSMNVSLQLYIALYLLISGNMKIIIKSKIDETPMILLDISALY